MSALRISGEDTSPRRHEESPPRYIFVVREPSREKGVAPSQGAITLKADAFTRRREKAICANSRAFDLHLNFFDCARHSRSSTLQ